MDQIVNPEAPASDDSGKSEIERLKENYENQLRGLNRANSKLKEELDAKTSAGKTVEERIAAIERDRQAAQRRADTMEAFGREGLTEDFRSLFDIEDPLERARTLKGLLDDYTSKAARSVASEFLRDPEAQPVSGNSRVYTMDQVAGMSTADINKLWAEGRIKGAAKKR